MVGLQGCFEIRESKNGEEKRLLKTVQNTERIESTRKQFFKVDSCQKSQKGVGGIIMKRKISSIHDTFIVSTEDVNFILFP